MTNGKPGYQFIDIHLSYLLVILFINTIAHYIL